MVESNRTNIKDYTSPNNTELHSSIVRFRVDVNNFELKLFLLLMVYHNQFSNSPRDDLNLHLSIFIEYCDILKMNEVTNDAIRLRLFSFLLRDIVKSWLHFLPSDSITT